MISVEDINQYYESYSDHFHQKVKGLAVTVLEATVPEQKVYATYSNQVPPTPKVNPFLFFTSTSNPSSRLRPTGDRPPEHTTHSLNMN